LKCCGPLLGGGEFQSGGRWFFERGAMESGAPLVATEGGKRASKGPILTKKLENRRTRGGPHEKKRPANPKTEQHYAQRKALRPNRKGKNSREPRGPRAKLADNGTPATPQCAKKFQKMGRQAVTKAFELMPKMKVLGKGRRQARNDVKRGEKEGNGLYKK